jgi:CheY-like chemotaxis protein
VSDTGSGMSEEVRQRCLEPFFSTKGEHGTGLGLGLVYGIIRRHEGQMSLETEEGKGTSFFIRLPALKDGEMVTVAAPVIGSQVQTPLHILVVDDEPSFCNLVSGFLTSDGHTVETANDGREGLRKFLAGRFDVVLLDQAMPEMSGTQVAAAIKQMTPDKPVILVSGFADVMEAVGEEPAGVDLLLSKPVTLERFREALAEVTTKN